MRKIQSMLFLAFIIFFTSTCIANEQEVFYGRWFIKKLVTSAAVSANSAADVQKLLGKEIVYSEDLVNFDNSSNVRPFYKKINFSSKHFQEEYNINLDRIGVKGNAVTEIDVYTDSALKDLWDGVGNAILIKNSNTLILFNGGDFFELSRKK